MKTLGDRLSFALIWGLMISCQNHSTSPDNDYDVTVNKPKLSGLRIVFDQGHKNHHQIDRTYQPFANLLRNDGSIVKSTENPIDISTLSTADIFVIGTAMGNEEPGEKSPFTDNEVNSLEAWIRNGGSVLLITEHYPFGVAMEPLLNKFGVIVHNGYTEDSTMINNNATDALLFDKSKGQLNKDHPITADISRVNTFTGSSVKGDSTWTPLLILSSNAQNYNVDVKIDREGGDVRVGVSYADFYPANDYAQGLCKIYGKGKIVILSESALLTAQIDKNGNKFGMNIADTDNKQFTLNIIRWLAERETREN
ncbi:hypothetical protein BH10BAC4_BH10BAC4_20260 [soil metagenome]